MRQFRKIVLKYLRPFLQLIYFKRYLNIKKEITSINSKKVDCMFFFPSYQIGGAEKVHLSILDALHDYHSITVITYKSFSSALKKDYKKKSGFFIDLGVTGNYTFYRNKIRKEFVNVLNRSRSPCTIFGCNNVLFYDIVDNISNPFIKCVDLIHAFSPYLSEGIEHRSLLSASKLDLRITINQKTKSDIKKQYQENSIPQELDSRIRTIYNPVSINCIDTQKDFSKPLKCLWIGRNSAEKRPYLIDIIATKCRSRKLPINFSIAGFDADYEGIHSYGIVTDPNQLSSIYQQHHFLLTTSSFEGFPLTIAEGMCNGLINITTDVGGINEHIKNNKTGFLIADSTSNDSIAEKFADLLQILIPEKLTEISENAKEYSKEHFSFTKFKKEYIQALIHE